MVGGTRQERRIFIGLHSQDKSQWDQRFASIVIKLSVYGSSGKKDLLSHSKHSSVHLSNKKSYLQTSRLPASWRTPGEHPVESETCSPLSRECRLPYGIAENVHNTATCPSLQENASCPIYSVNDRKHHLEAYILSFVTENSLPLSSVPKLIEFANFLSRDVKVLSKVEMNRTAATYKLKDGLAVHVKKSIVAAMKKYPFSINIDECTSNNNHKVFSLLVSYFDAVVGKCVVQHLRICQHGCSVILYRYFKQYVIYLRETQFRLITLCQIYQTARIT